ncbi:hypothetical protein [Xanthomonas arboricola]|uniref:hypothetical protein n=1 Tax=Xanthomonas arboricola TaxID=56448 RepID=UPI001E3CA358|nr:hypothetical protein [Xanthomonas arboricola]
MRLIFVALMQLGSSSLHAAEPCRDLQTTSASNACWNQQVGISQERLDDYLATARDTAISTLGVPPTRSTTHRRRGRLTATFNAAMCERAGAMRQSGRQR